MHAHSHAPPLTVTHSGRHPQVVQHSEGIAAISREASQEAALEALLAQVADSCRRVDLDLQPLRDERDAYVLGSADALRQARR